MRSNGSLIDSMLIMLVLWIGTEASRRLRVSLRDEIIAGFITERLRIRESRPIWISASWIE